MLVATNGTIQTGPGLMTVGDGGLEMYLKTPSGSFPGAVGIDPQSGALVWADWRNKAIYVTSPSGESHREVVKLNLSPGKRIQK